ncbi:KIR protein [Plasmodium coatneyi]|uniref:KIR protein n=1 Tax=Plasmodium coatneyi TaxID=208452 RepID=A0A1B1DVB7_9APIC|nr:KIR protein [Plasmodium coatneyi]ANQ06718.1 KIR protein [Plasmodium coatneyi]
MAKPATADLTEDDLKKLPSRKEYVNFSNGQDYRTFCTPDGSYKQLESKWDETMRDCSNASNYTDKVVGAYCYASSKVTNANQSRGLQCQYFYYWLWNLLKNTLHIQSPLDTKKKVYQEFETISSENWCKIIYNDISDEGFFPQVKIHFDYSKDYETLQSQLGNGVSGTKTCDSTYHKHLDTIQSACSAIEEDFKQDGGPQKSGSYCDPLKAGGKGSAGEYCSEGELQKLHCEQVPKSNPNPNQAGSSGKSSLSDADQSAGGALASAAVGSTLATLGIGLPALALFLYKVKYYNNYNYHYVYIYICISRGNARRKKRTSRIKHEFDTSTEDSSTIYSTTADTSTIDGSTKDNSTIYNGGSPPRRPSPPGQKRRVANNATGRRKNIGYQRI